MEVPFSTLLLEWSIFRELRETKYAKHELALFQNRTAFDLDVEKVQLLVSLHNVAALIDPDQRVLDLLATLGRLVDADVDVQLGLAGFVLQAEHELTLLHGFGEGDGLGGGGADVVAGFGEEEGLDQSDKWLAGAIIVWIAYLCAC